MYLDTVELGNLKGKLERFTMDARSTPEPVFPAHLPNEFSQLKKFIRGALVDRETSNASRPEILLDANA